MKSHWEAVVGGLAGGLVSSLAMAAAERSGRFYPTLAEASEDYLDRTMNTREWAGERGTAAMEQANHMTASAALGYGYGVVRDIARDHAPDVPPAVLGAGYGAALYAVNIAGVSPVVGITEGERAAPMGQSAQRLGVHVVWGVTAALVADALERRTQPTRRH